MEKPWWRKEELGPSIFFKDIPLMAFLSLSSTYSSSYHPSIVSQAGDPTITWASGDFKIKTIKSYPQSPQARFPIIQMHSVNLTASTDFTFPAWQPKCKISSGMQGKFLTVSYCQKLLNELPACKVQEQRVKTTISKSEQGKVKKGY